MLSLKSKATDVALLEANVQKAVADQAAAKAAYRATRLDFEDAKGRLAEKDFPDRQTEYNIALDATRKASQAVDAANKALTEATLALDVTKTMPQRQASAKRIDEAIAVLKKAHPGVRLALASMCEALSVASFPEIAGVSQAGCLFSQHIHNANAAATGGDLERFIAELESYRDGMLDGTKPATLAPTFEEQRRQVVA